MFIDNVQSTYLCNPYRGSFDLIYAVARQYKFAYKITKLVSWKLPNDITEAIDDYKEFLGLLKSNKNLIAVPTIKAGKNKSIFNHAHVINLNK